LWAVVGLGNPGERYSKTRHNVGFMVVDEIAQRLHIGLKAKESYRIGKGSIEERQIILVEPLTFMNRSGSAVGAVLKRYNIPTENLIVIQDDIDMQTGRLKIKKKGSSGGHNGIESIIQVLGTSEFKRVKIGVGREEGVPAEIFVLKKFRKEEVPLVKDAVLRAADAIDSIVKHGFDRAMSMMIR
jgi:peptidyl-tRNA hydrolase, PTH1 family